MFKTARWRDVKKVDQTQIPVSVKAWLLDQGSLTQRLIAASNGHFRVECLHQGFVVPLLNEAQLLGLKPRQKAWIREVCLYCYDEPWVYARSIVPVSSLLGRLRFLRQLKNTALGSLLFKDPFLQRSHFEVSIIGEASQKVFARRSLFLFYQQPLLVAEFFLPSCRLVEPIHQNIG